MLILLSSKASQIEVPAGAEICAPCGQYSGWGRILMMGMLWCQREAYLDSFNVFASKGFLDTTVHALRSEVLGALG